MSSTNDMRVRIASELNRALSDGFGNSGETVATAINRCINAAIQHYESTRFRWNEVRESEFATTVAGTRNVSLPANFISMDTLKLVYSGGYQKVTKRSWEEIDTKDTRVSGSSGIPSEYTIYGNVLRLNPTPNAALTLVASFIKRELPTSCTGSYTAVIPIGSSYSLTVTSTASHNNRINGWFTDGEALIRARAKADMLINYIKKPEAIAEMQGVVSRREPYLSVQEGLAYERLADETSDALATGSVRPYCI